MHPKDHRSAVWSYGFSSTSSGDMYRGVPLIEVSTKVETLIALANLQQDCIMSFMLLETIETFFFATINIPKVAELHHTAFF